MKEKINEQKNNNNFIRKILPVFIPILIVVILIFVLSLFNKDVVKCNITFETNGGSSVEGFAIEKDNTITKPEDPKKENHKFVGWYYNGEIYDFSKPVTGDIKLEAKWEKIESVLEGNLGQNNEDITEIISGYKVTFKDVDGTSLASAQIVKNGNKAVEPEQPTKTGHIFQGWYNGETKYTFAEEVRGNIQLTAKWIKETYTIVFVNDDDSVLEVKKVEYGTLPTCATPKSTQESNAQYSYVFNGWSPKVSAATEYAKYTATYIKKINNYNVTFKDENGEILSNTQTIEYGNNATKPAEPVKKGHTFNGWYNGDNEYTFAEEVIGNVELTAKWIKNKYTVKFVNEDGTILDEQILEYGTMPVYSGEVPTKMSDKTYTYSFKGWDKDIIEVEENVTYTAAFNETYIDYVIKFVDEDGTEILQKLYHYGDTVVEPNRPTKPSDEKYTYTFAGWEPKVTIVEENTTYTATYTSELNKYEVIFKDEDGTLLVDTQIVEHGSKAEKPENPTKKGHTFDGWYNNNTQYTFIDEVTDNITLTAKWTKNKYKITFINYDGVVLESKMLEYGETPTYSTPNREGNQQYTYEFAGWNPNLVEVEDNAIYTATYMAILNKYEVTFKDEDGTELADAQTVEYGSKATEPTKPTREGYTFLGWYKGEEQYTFAEEVTGNVELTAKWSKNKYTITFVNYDGTVLETQILEYGAIPIYRKETPTREADAQYTYKFDGWDPHIKKVSNDITYTAKYTTAFNKYQITFKDEDGTILANAQIVEYGNRAEKPEQPSKEGYTFKGWYNGDVEYTFTEEITCDVELTAKWELNKYTITFKNYDGSILEKQTVEHGKLPAYTKSTPTREDDKQYTYTFKGWDKEIINAYNDATYTATFTGTYIDYIVVFVNEDGTEISKNTYHYGESVQQPNAPTKVADAQYTYAFAGWNPEVTVVTQNITYTATYSGTLNKYQVTFKDEDGTELADAQTVEYGSKAEEPIQPSKEGYTFKGWYNGNEKYTFVEEITGDVELTAKWELNKYTITFKNYDESILETQTVEHGTLPVYTKSTPTKAADAQYTYTFAGWDTEIIEAYNDATYTATFTNTIRTYVVTFKDVDGTVLAEAQTVPYGKTATKPNEPSKKGYKFDGWYIGDVKYTFTETVKENVELTAKWNINKYTIKFVNYDDSILETQTVEHGKTPVYTKQEPTKPANGGNTYKFVGWTPSITVAEKDMTYKATFENFVDINNKIDTALATTAYSGFTVNKKGNTLNVKFSQSEKIINMFEGIVDLFDVLSCNEEYESFKLYYKHGNDSGQTIDLTKYNLKDKKPSSWFGGGPNDRVGDWLGYLATGTASTSAAFGASTDDLIGKTVNVTVNLKDGYILENGQNTVTYYLTFSY